MPKFRHHKYTYSNPFGSPRHHWELVGPEGGIHFHVSLTKGYDPSCGLEFHHAARAGYRRDEAPDHINCPLIGEPCWHDGTSLYASETIWPMVEPMLRSGDHEAIFRTLEHEYSRRFDELMDFNRLSEKAA
jgi:hypothetical protein